MEADRTRITTTASRMVTARAWLSTRLALSRSSWPLRRATMAETATFMERKRARAMNLGWVQRPTAAMAAEPSVPTMMVSMTPTRATRKDSRMEGQAIWRVSRRIRGAGGISPLGSSRPRRLRPSKSRRRAWNKGSPAFGGNSPCFLCITTFLIPIVPLFWRNASRRRGAAGVTPSGGGAWRERLVPSTRAEGR